MARRALSRAALPLAAALVIPVVLRADDPVRVRFGWSATADCRREVRVDVDVPADPKIVRGRLRHVGRNPIRNVTVCFGSDCASVAGGTVIATGASMPFQVRGSGKRPTTRCSILEERAGA